MLPDLRIVIAAVLTTFVLTIGVGFYASSRLIQEPKKRTDSLAALDETPVNRIALSWPEPTRQADQPALDFAVTAKALRNPVRDITNEPAAWQTPQQSAAATPERAAEASSPSRRPETPIKIEPLTPAAEVTQAPAAPAVAIPAPEPQPDIRIAIQYPPIPELPRELRAPAPAAATPREPQQELSITTGSVAETPGAASAAPERTQPEPRIASRPEPDPKEDGPENAQAAEPKPAPKAARKKAAPKKADKKADKKAAPAKAKRPAQVVRRTARSARPATTAFPFFWGNTLR